MPALICAIALGPDVRNEFGVGCHVTLNEPFSHTAVLPRVQLSEFSNNARLPASFTFGAPEALY